MNEQDLHKMVLIDMEDKLNHHKMLAKYTKKTTKLKLHLWNINFWEETIDDYKQEYNLN